MRDSWHNKHIFIMSIKSREPISKVKLYRNVNGEVYSQMSKKEIKENIIPNCKVRVEYVENGALIKKQIIPIQHCKKYINTVTELISIKDVVSVKIAENQEIYKE